MNRDLHRSIITTRDGTSPPRVFFIRMAITLRRAIEQLPPGYQLVFKLHDIEGLEHNEITDLLQCSIGNCKSQLHKARQRLMRTLGVNADPLALLANFDRFIASEEPSPESPEDV